MNALAKLDSENSVIMEESYVKKA
ncbi:uncharacterized protein METZ01_LOCUS171329, partial [marine metagenome]